MITSQRTANICAIIQTVLLLLGTIYGIRAFHVYRAQNTVNARAQLYSTERELADRELNDPSLQLAYVRVGSAVPADQYAATILLQYIPEEEKKTLEKGGLFKLDYAETSKTKQDYLNQMDSAEKLYNTLWGEGVMLSPTSTRLRSIYLHLEKCLYHMHNAFDYGAEGILKPGEWNEWKGMIQDIGGHPVMLACLYSAHDRGYMSKEFAAELQNIYSADPRTKAIIESYYSGMLGPKWLSAFKSRGD